MSERELPPLPPQAPAARPKDASREGRPVSFYLAIFLGLLLLVSGALNLLLLVVSALGSATGGFMTAAEDADGMYDIVGVAGDAAANVRLLRVPIEGAIAEDETPVLGSSGGTVTQIRRALKAAAADDAIKGVLLDIDSPGGGVTDSDEIWRLLTAFRAEHKKPVLALFGDIAASGGYYIAAACDRIMARPTTITGSIGVIMQSYNVAEAAQKLGIKVETIISDATPYKDMLSPMRPMRDEERAVLKSIVQEYYDRFVDIVDQGRSELSRDQVKYLADGRVYSAQQAQTNGLVDAIGSIEDAYAELRRMCSIDAAHVVEQRRKPSLGEVLFGVRTRAPSLEQAAASLLHSGSGPRLLYYWNGAR